MSYYTKNANFHGWGPEVAQLNPEKINLLTKFAQGKVLDLGCGSGIYSYYLAKRGHRVFGIDVQSEFIQKAKSRYKHKNLTFQLASALKLPFKSDSFDTVVAFDVLEHVNDKKALLEISRVAKKVIISVPHQNQKILTQWSLAHHHYMDKTHQREYTQDSLKMLLETSGFKIIYLTPSLPISLYGLVAEHLSKENKLKKLLIKILLKPFTPEPPLYSTLFAVAEKIK